MWKPVRKPEKRIRKMKKRNVVGKLETDLLETWEVKQKTARSLSWQVNKKPAVPIHPALHHTGKIDSLRPQD